MSELNDKDDLRDPQTYRVEPSFPQEPQLGGYVIVNASGEWVEPKRVYITEDAAWDAIANMCGDDDNDRRLNRGRHADAYYERLAEEESSGPRLCAGDYYGSAGRR